MPKEVTAMTQSGRKIQIPTEIGIDRISAVKADNCCGDRFLVLNIYSKLLESGEKLEAGYWMLVASIQYLVSSI